MEFDSITIFEEMEIFTSEDESESQHKESNIIRKLKNNIRRLQKEHKFREKSLPTRDHKVLSRIGVKDSNTNHNEDNQTLVSISVGRSSLRCTIVRIGELNLNPAFADGESWFPIGFLSRRKYFDFQDRDFQKTKVIFGSSITVVDNLPRFEIRKITAKGKQHINVEESFEPSEVVASGDRPDQVWSEFVNHYSTELKPVVEEDFLSLQQFFGLSHDTVKRSIQELVLKSC